MGKRWPANKWGRKSFYRSQFSRDGSSTIWRHNQVRAIYFEDGTSRESGMRENLRCESLGCEILRLCRRWSSMWDVIELKRVWTAHRNCPFNLLVLGSSFLLFLFFFITHQLWIAERTILNFGSPPKARHQNLHLEFRTHPVKVRDGYPSPYKLRMRNFSA